MTRTHAAGLRGLPFFLRAIFSTTTTARHGPRFPFIQPPTAASGAMHAAVVNLMLEVGALVVVAALFARLVVLVANLCFFARAIHFIYVVDVCMYEWRVNTYGVVPRPGTWTAVCQRARPDASGTQRTMV